MGLIDNLRRVSGIAKNRLASATGALRTQVRGLSVRVPRILGLTARAARLTTPLGIGITAATFAPQIARGARIAGQAIAKGIAFFGGRQVVTAAGAGGVVGALSTRRKGEPTRPSEAAKVNFVTTQRRPSAVARGGAPRVTRKKPRRPSAVARGGAPRRRRRKTTATRRRIPTHGHRVVSTGTTRVRTRRGARRRTHSSPRHKGHKRVSFTTASGKRVSFLANPKARHR